MLSHFPKIYSIELQPTFHRDAVEKFKGNSNVKILFGDSSEKLSEIEYDTNVFFLDGHWSGNDTAQGPKDCPLLEELDIINQRVTGKSIIIIDDSRLFGKNKNDNWQNPDWTDITIPNIIDRVKDRVVYQIDQNDRYIICLDEKS